MWPPLSVRCRFAAVMIAWVRFSVNLFGGFDRGVWGDRGGGAPGRRALRGGASDVVCGNRCRGAHSAAVGGSAAYGCGVPLRAACARPSPARWVSIERAHSVRPYIRYTEAFRLTGDGAPRSSRPTEIYIATALPASTAAFAAQRTAKQPSSPGGKSWRGRQSGSGCL